MPKVNLTINQHNYVLQCKDGEEQRLLECAQHLQHYATQNASAAKQFGETHLMVLAALMCVDEIFDVREQVESLKVQLFEIQEQGKEWESKEAEREKFFETLESLRQRIETMAEKLSPPLSPLAGGG